MNLKSQELICYTNDERFWQSFLNDTVFQIFTRFSVSSVLGFFSFFFVTYAETHYIREKLTQKRKWFFKVGKLSWISFG